MYRLTHLSVFKCPVLNRAIYCLLNLEIYESRTKLISALPERSIRNALGLEQAGHLLPAAFYLTSDLGMS